MRDYNAEGSVWKQRRMRYIYHTTGLYAMRRFLNLPANRDYIDNYMTSILCNRFEDYPNLTLAQRHAYDVLTRRSNSYFTDKFEIKVPVSTENVALFFPPTYYKKISGKNMDSCYCWSRGSQPNCDGLAESWSRQLRGWASSSDSDGDRRKATTQALLDGRGSQPSPASSPCKGRGAPGSEGRAASTSSNLEPINFIAAVGAVLPRAWRRLPTPAMLAARSCWTVS